MTPYWNDPRDFGDTGLQEASVAEMLGADIADELGIDPSDVTPVVEAYLPDTHRGWGEFSFIYFFNYYLSDKRTDSFAPAHFDLAQELEKSEVRKRVLWLYPREHAKCQSGDALVQLSSGEQKKLKDIRQGDEVVGINGYRLSPAKVEWAGPTGKKSMLKVVTESGNELKISHVHKLRTFDGWTEGSKLKVGDYVAAPRFIPEPVSPEPLEDAEAAILGYWLAEGCRGQGCLTMSNHDPQVLSDIDYWASCLGITSAILKDNRYPGKGVGVRLHKGGNDVIRNFGIDPDVCGAHDKYIPQRMFRASNRQIALMLSRLFESDGSTHLIRGKPVISYCTAAKRLAQDIRSILLRFGIISRLSESHVDGKLFWKVLLQGEDAVESFKEHIGFYTKKVVEHEAVRRQARHELIPPQWRKMRVDGAPDARWSYGIRIDNKYATTRDKVRKVAELDGNQELLDLVDADVWWDKIKSIEVIPDEETYDISVEGIQNYISDGVVSHNTTIITFGYVLWCICYNKKRNIIIGSDSKSQAKEFLRNIKTELEVNEKIFDDFGDLVGSSKTGGKWDETHVITSNQVQIKTVSPGSSVRGVQFNQRKKVWDNDLKRDVMISEIIRPDLCILDDVINDKWIRNKQLRDELENWVFSPLINALDSKTGDLIIVGTTIHNDDLMNRIWKDQERTIDWVKVKTPACELQADGTMSNVLWPGRWPEEKLQKRMQEIGSLAFSREFLLKPEDESSKFFSAEWFKYYTDYTMQVDQVNSYYDAGISPAPRDLLLVTSVDPNSKKGDRSDYTVVMTVGFCPRTRGYYIIDVYRDRPTPETLCKEMVNQALKWGKQYRQDGGGWVHLGFAVETVGYQESIAYWLKKEMDLRGVTEARIWKRSENVDKDIRNSGMSPMVEQGRLFFPLGWRENRHTNTHHVIHPMAWLEEELDEYRAAYDDGVDALQRCYSVLLKEEKRYVYGGTYSPGVIEEFGAMMDAYSHQKKYIA